MFCPGIFRPLFPEVRGGVAVAGLNAVWLEGNQVHLDIRSLVLGFFAGTIAVSLGAACLLCWVASMRIDSYDGERMSNLDDLVNEPATPSAETALEAQAQAVGQTL
jgi:hypothetical protein